MKGPSKYRRYTFQGIYVSEILTFFYYANYLSDDVILFATEKW